MARPRKDSSPVAPSNQTTEQFHALFRSNIKAIAQWYKDQNTGGPDAIGYYVIMEGAMNHVLEAWTLAMEGKQWEPYGAVKKS